jgi:hypothetical protein
VGVKTLQRCSESSQLIDRFLFIVAIIGVGAWLGIASLGSITAQPVAFVLLYSIAFVAYYLGVRYVIKRQQIKHVLLLILFTGLILRILVFNGAPSDDMYRYLWEGEVQRIGLNPYILPPDAPELATLRDSSAYASLINHESWTAIYPPLALLWHRAFGESVGMLKASFLVAEGILLFFVWRLLVFKQMPPERILIYWWNPLPVFAFSYEGHHDAVALAFLMAALYGLMVMRTQIVATIAWPAAVLSKGFALVVWPVFAERLKLSMWPWTLIFGLLVTLPFLGAGPDLWKSLTQFGGELHYNDSLHALFLFGLQAMDISNPLWSRLFSLLTGIAIFLWVMVKVKPDPLLRSAWLIGGLLLVLPTVHQWYLITLLPFLCFFPWPGWLFLTGTCVLPFLAQLEIFHTGEWVEWHWLKPFEYAPLFVWLFWCAYKKWQCSHQDESCIKPEKSSEISCT